MAWLVPYNRLDDQQREFVDNRDFNSNNYWIKGFPGSGKSVLLAHTINKIKSKNQYASIVVIVFTRSLAEMFKAAFQEMNIHVDIQTYYQFCDGSAHYDYILCDEVQDLTPRVLREMKNRGSHIVVAGDSNQSIYDTDPKWRESTVTPSQIPVLLNASSYELGIIHRLSSSIISAVQKFLPHMNIFSAKRDMTKQSTQVRLCSANNSGEEEKYIMREALKAIQVGQTAAILVPNKEKIIQFVNAVLEQNGIREWSVTLNKYGKLDYDSMNHYLRRHGIKLKYVGNGYGNFDENDRCITMMTFHSSKGLDFDNVFLPYLTSGMRIVSDESLSKTLFMVAMTRSRNNLYLTYTGYKSNYLNAFSCDCSNIDIHSVLTSASSSYGGTSNVFGI